MNRRRAEPRASAVQFFWFAVAICFVWFAILPVMQDLFPSHYDRMGFVSFLLAMFLVFVVAILIRDAASVDLTAATPKKAKRDDLILKRMADTNATQQSEAG